MKEAKLLTIEYKDEFDKVVSHPIQSWAWGDFKESMGAVPERIGFFENGKLVGGLQIIFSKLSKTKYTVGYSAKGIIPDNAKLEIIKETAKKHNAIFIKIEPDVYEPVSNENKITKSFIETEKYILSNGGVRGKPLFTKYDFHLDINKDCDELLASFHSKTRYNIRLAEKKGVKIIDNTTEKGMEDYIRLMEETTKRQGFFNHNAKYFQNLFKIFPKNSLKILEAVYNEEVLTAWILFNFNGKLYYPYGASGNNHRELMPNNLIMWEAIKYGKNLNCSVFDLWGCLGPNPNTADSWYGFHKFKSGYNPQLVEYIGTFDFVYKPFMYKLFNIADKIRWIILKNKHR